MQRATFGVIAIASVLSFAGCSSDSGSGSSESGGSAGFAPGTGGTTAGSGGSLGGGGTTGLGGYLGGGGSSMGGGNPGIGGATSGGSSMGGSNPGNGGSSSGGVIGPAGGLSSGGATSGGSNPGNGGSTIGGESGVGGSTMGGDTGAGGSTMGGDTGAGGGAKTPGTAQQGDITVDPATTFQTMDGFGIADVWQGQNTSSAEQRTLFWDPDQGIGMSILRIGIDETGQIMGDAGYVEGPVVSGFGGKVWAAPWSPPGNLKDNGDMNNGGHLNASEYDTWASTLAAFPAIYKQHTGDDLWGISAQNEPDFVASYRSCIYDADQMNAFIKVLGPKLQALTPAVKLLAAEPDVWSHTWDNGDRYGTAIEGDATVSGLVDIIATHDYGANVQSTTRPSPPANLSHHIWQTEATYTAGADIGPALDFDRCIYAAVTSGGASGWVYWWTPEFMNGGSTANPPKRVYAMGNFSKFVRPDYVRVDISGVPSAVQIVPFANPADGTLVIVALNSGNSAQQASFFVSGTAWPDSVTPYVTSSSSNLQAGSSISLDAARFSASLAGQSITTFVGKP